MHRRRNNNKWNVPQSQSQTILFRTLLHNVTYKPTYIQHMYGGKKTYIQHMYGGNNYIII